jgi:hypothetical protein
MTMPGLSEMAGPAPSKSRNGGQGLSTEAGARPKGPSTGLSMTSTAGTGGGKETGGRGLSYQTPSRELSGKGSTGGGQGVSTAVGRGKSGK